MKKTILGTILGVLTGICTGIAIGGKFLFRTNEGENVKVGKYKKYYYMLNEWLRLKQAGQTLEIFFEEQGYQDIAIYGMGEVGNRLYNELKDSNVNVRYAIDKNGGLSDDDLEIKDIDDDLDGIDVIVVTATFAFEDIVNNLKDKVECPIISLEDVVYGME